MQESKTLHYILGISLAMIAIFAAASLVMVNSQADSVSTSGSVNNAAPTIVSKFISSSANGQTDTYSGGTINNLTAGGTRTIHINGVVEDTNGQADISTVEAVFYRSGVGGSCTESSNDCYKVASCTLDTTGVTSLQKRYNCSMALQYYADSTSTGGEFPTENWVVSVKVTDAGSLNATDTALTKEMQTLLGLTIPSSIAYGALALGASTSNANNQEQVIAQAGNDNADVEVSSGAAMSCTIGTIAVANQQWSLTDVSYGAGGTNALSGSAVDTNLNVAYRHGANPTKTLYWNITIPSTGVGGSCTGTTTISAIAA